MTIGARILAADAMRRIPSPCCRRIHVVDPSLRISVRCCGQAWMPRKIIGGLELRALTRRGVA